jgi:hypothetical protein
MITHWLPLEAVPLSSITTTFETGGFSSFESSPPQAFNIGRDIAMSNRILPNLIFFIIAIVLK